MRSWLARVMLPPGCTVASFPSPLAPSAPAAVTVLPSAAVSGTAAARQKRALIIVRRQRLLPEGTGYAGEVCCLSSPDKRAEGWCLRLTMFSPTCRTGNEFHST